MTKEDLAELIYDNITDEYVSDGGLEDVHIDGNCNLLKLAEIILDKMKKEKQ